MADPTVGSRAEIEIALRDSLSLRMRRCGQLLQKSAVVRTNTSACDCLSLLHLKEGLPPLLKLTLKSMGCSRRNEPSL